MTVKTDTKSTRPKASAYAGLADMLGKGFEPGLTKSDHMKQIAIADIEIRPQVRVEFEDEENTLAELGKDLRKRQAQNIVVRPARPGAAKPYELVVGERRVRGALIEGLTHLWALVAELSDEEAEDLQFKENIHRKNLTQLEEAKRIQRDLDQLGSVEAVLTKHNKSRAWLSKITSLLNLPDQAKRLVAESISADLEVINTVKTIEKADPTKARALVEDLKATRGRANARDKVAAVKEEVKPSKKERKPLGSGADGVATARDRSQQDPGPASVRAGSRAGLTPSELLASAYVQLFEFGANPNIVIETLTAQQRAGIEELLSTAYEAGKQAKDVARGVMLGFRSGQFATDAEGAMKLVAFLQGAHRDAKFSLLNILGAVKQ